MIEELTGLQEGTVGFKFTGHVSGSDYDLGNDRCKFTPNMCALQKVVFLVF